MFSKWRNLCQFECPVSSPARENLRHFDFEYFKMSKSYSAGTLVSLKLANVESLGGLTHYYALTISAGQKILDAGMPQDQGLRLRCCHRAS